MSVFDKPEKLVLLDFLSRYDDIDFSSTPFNMTVIKFPPLNFSTTLRDYAISGCLLCLFGSYSSHLSQRDMLATGTLLRSYLQRDLGSRPVRSKSPIQGYFRYIKRI